MPRVTHKSPPRRRRPRDPRIATAAPRADAAARAAHPDTQTPSAARLAEASAQGRGVMAWHTERPRVIDARTGRPPATKHTRRITGPVTSRIDPSRIVKDRPAPSPWSRP